MRSMHKWNYRIHLLFVIAILGAILGFQPERWLKAEISIGQVDVYKIEYQEQEQLRTSKWTEYEVSKVLQSITSMRAAHFPQLPVPHLLFKFERDVVLEDSPVPFPIREMVVTLPDRKGDQSYLLLKNPQGQWIAYDTSHPLTLLTRDYH